MSAYGSGRAKDTDHRRTWDKAEYAKKAQERERNERSEAVNGSRKRKGLVPLRSKEDEEKVPEGTATYREKKLKLDANVGKTQIVESGDVRQAGFRCDVCKGRTFKDSNSYLDHINGKEHLEALGVSSTIKRVDVKSVKERLAELKRLKDAPKKEYDLDARVEEAKREEEEERQKRKEKKRQKKEAKKKAKEQAESQNEQEGDDDMARMMGFGGFGTTKV